MEERYNREKSGPADQTSRPGTSQRRQGMLEKIAAYVDEHLTEKITLHSVADYCGVSISTVTQLFQKKAGTTFHQFLTGRRMAAAKKLIHEGMPLEEVGRYVGYVDHSTFYRAFRQAFGVSPREYRSRLTAGK